MKKAHFAVKTSSSSCCTGGNVETSCEADDIVHFEILPEVQFEETYILSESAASEENAALLALKTPGIPSPSTKQLDLAKKRVDENRTQDLE